MKPNLNADNLPIRDPPTTETTATKTKTERSPSTNSTASADRNNDFYNDDKKEKPPDPRGIIYNIHEKDYFLTKKVLFCFDITNPIRKACIWLITWKYFDWFIMTIILANAIFMGLADYGVVDETGNPFPTDFRTGKTSTMNQIIEGADPTFTGIYCVEAFIKIIALGFVSGPNTYLRDGWNVLDFVAVVSSAAALVPNVPNVSSLRTLRVLRPLRSLKMLPGMKGKIFEISLFGFFFLFWLKQKKKINICFVY